MDKARHEKMKAIRSRNARKSTLKNLFGITFEQYDRMLAEQENRCSICQDTLGVGKDRHIDHCHETGKIRAILCAKCNKGLGHFRDNPELLLKAAEYIKSHNV